MSLSESEFAEIRDRMAANGRIELRKIAHASAKGGARSSKYGNKRKEIDGITFASSAEAKAYIQLKALAVTGEIWNLKLQPSYVLQEAFRDTAGKHHRAIRYVADFTFLRRYTGNTCKQIAVDVKGMATPVFLLKEKMFRAKYEPHIILEVWK